VIAILAFIIFVFLLVLEIFTSAGEAPYAGLVIFVAVPTVLLCGLAIIPLGMLMESRRLRRGGPARLRFPVIDFNDPHHRNAALVFVVGSILLLFLSVFGSFQAYEATESVGFCGRLCHQVMSPEYTAYQNSPHARVRCVDCHVGSGAGWYVKSKLSGAYQVYAVLFNKYPRPIPAPISSLRPAQQTCEQCHWPRQFFGGQQKEVVHFLPDENNTRWNINLLIKTGGGDPATGRTEGIHWHMNIAFRVEYIATDRRRQNITWVRTTNLETGVVTEYTSTANPLTQEEISRANIRTMDCMDCHDRPTHIFRSPSYLVNLALDTGVIDPTLPSIKETAVNLLTADHDSVSAALAAIEQGILGFYETKHPDLLNQRREAIAHAVAAVQKIYRENFFPEMRVRWDAYIDNIGHLTAPGCFRCHGGLHRSSDGKTITKSCTVCHIIMGQGTPPQVAVSMDAQGLTFQHPEEIGDVWQEMNCSECHTGALP
jgi:nitrate/TMAO reductase-like tetraheme cytochrome c subunit